MKLTDPYAELSVPRDADPETVKAAYRKAAKQHHPDKGGDAEKFAAATLAHDVLMDEKRRKKFDETGKIDDSPVAGKEQRAQQLIYDMVAHAIMGDVDPLGINLVSQMDQSLQKQIADIATKTAVLKRGLERAKRLEKRFVKKGKKKDPENIFVTMLQRHKQQITEAMEMNETETEIRQMALDMVRLYTFNPEVAVNAFTVRYAVNTGWGGTGTGL
jgi:curved DNA-binding protein CbpA